MDAPLQSIGAAEGRDFRLKPVQPCRENAQEGTLSYSSISHAPSLLQVPHSFAPAWASPSPRWICRPPPPLTTPRPGTSLATSLRRREATLGHLCTPPLRVSGTEAVMSSSQPLKLRPSKVVQTAFRP